MSTAIQPKEKALVFISYAREDEVFVDELVKKLGQYNVEPVGDWLLTPGEKYEIKLKELNLRAQCLVFVITPDSIKSQVCHDELATAVESRKQVPSEDQKSSRILSRSATSSTSSYKTLVGS
ncbi:MAG TPA: toll/interleukin-1 receptor domain-containing protein [Pyrinomonadaceae bacterium]|nr:toll/interleukin-1 receptor domain-containing protein [Pyrinomonadaceae bacterium]